MRKRSAGAAALVTVLALLAGCGSVGPYAAKVNGASISQSSLEDEMRAIAANDAYVKRVESQLQVRGSGPGTFDAVFTGQVLSRQIQYVLVEREIDKRELKITEADLRAARAEVANQAGGEEILKGFSKEYQDTLVERAAKVDALTVALTGQKATEEAARAYYDSHKEEFAEVCLSHILVATKEKADQIKARLGAGEDFGAVAKAESQDAQSAGQNGELSCQIHADSIAVPEFVQVILNQPVNEVTNPVQTQFGFHLIKVRSRSIPEYDQAAQRAREKIVGNGQAKLQEWVTGAVAGAKIAVNPKYGTFDKQQLKVVPPVAPTTTAPATPPGSGIQPLRP
ncbi:MAG: peptidylprolyl isomerase [Acidimicrobiales bacterium]